MMTTTKILKPSAPPEPHLSHGDQIFRVDHGGESDNNTWEQICM